MAIKFVQTIDMGQNQILNLQLQNLASDPGTPVKGQIWINTTSNVLKYYDGTTVQTLGQLSNNINQLGLPTSPLNMNSQAIQNLGTPVNATDAATKGYVDSATIGLSVHASVVAATTVAGVIASSFANGSIIDGITLATGNRILIKNQVSSAENGIYTVNVSGAPTRSSDCNSSTNYITGSFVFVEEGTINQGASFVVNTQGTIIVGTTPVIWVQFSGAANTSLNLSGGNLGSIPYQSATSTTSMLSGPSTNGTYALVEVVSGGVSVAPTFTNAPALSAANMTNFPSLGAASATSLALSTPLPLSSGGVGSITQSGARSTIGATGKYATTFGDGVSTSYVVTHNLGSTDVVVGVSFVASPFQVVLCEVQLTSINTITLLFASPPSTNTLRAVVIG